MVPSSEVINIRATDDSLLAIQAHRYILYVGHYQSKQLSPSNLQRCADNQPAYITQIKIHQGDVHWQEWPTPLDLQKPVMAIAAVWSYVELRDQVLEIFRTDIVCVCCTWHKYLMHRFMTQHLQSVRSSGLLNLSYRIACQTWPVLSLVGNFFSFL